MAAVGTTETKRCASHQAACGQEPTYAVPSGRIRWTKNWNACLAGCGEGFAVLKEVQALNLDTREATGEQTKRTLENRRWEKEDLVFFGVAVILGHLAKRPLKDEIHCNPNEQVIHFFDPSRAPQKGAYSAR